MVFLLNSDSDLRPAVIVALVVFNSMGFTAWTAQVAGSSKWDRLPLRWPGDRALEVPGRCAKNDPNTHHPRS